MIGAIANRAARVPSPGAVPAADPAPAPPRDKASELRNVAGQLEGLFVQQLFKVMRETVPQGEGIVSGGAGEEIFTGLLDQHLAAETPKQWQSGISEALYRQLRGVAGLTSPDPSATPAASASPSSPDTSAI